jgi:hypothetical protein
VPPDTTSRVGNNRSDGSQRDGSQEPSRSTTTDPAVHAQLVGEDHPTGNHRADCDNGLDLAKPRVVEPDTTSDDVAQRMRVDCERSERQGAR